MKALRTHDYRLEGYGLVSFIKRDAGNGSAIWRVIWRRVGLDQGEAIGRIQPGQKPCAELAIFYCKCACALEDGRDRYHYHDKHLEPPKRSDSLSLARV